jgi:hypothetical protein
LIQKLAFIEPWLLAKYPGMDVVELLHDNTTREASTASSPAIAASHQFRTKH